MRINGVFAPFAFTAFILFSGCSEEEQATKHLTNNSYTHHQSQIREAVFDIKADIESSDVDDLQAAHLDSDKFTKFGPRNFERQDVAGANASESAFFSSITNVKYQIKELKIDVFGDVGIATYYPEVSFTRNGNEVTVSGRQTLVFLKTEAGWKIVHEHGTVRKP